MLDIDQGVRVYGFMKPFADSTHAVPAGDVRWLDSDTARYYREMQPGTLANLTPNYALGYWGIALPHVHSRLWVRPCPACAERKAKGSTGITACMLCRDVGRFIHQPAEGNFTITYKTKPRFK